MKTGRLGRFFWLVAAVAAVMASGCGARTVSDAQEPAVAGTATNAVAAAEPQPGAGEAPAVPPVRRSEAPAVALPAEVNEVVKLVESGAGEEVVRAYVGTSLVPFDLTLDQIIYLRDIGISDAVIASMMRRGSELRDRANETAAMQTNLVAAVEQIREAIATNQPAAAPVAEAAEAPAPAPEGAAPAPSPVVASVAAAPTDAPAEVTQFYSSLSPYGTWYQVPSYGWVWQPSVVVVNGGWAPYCHGGRWVWSDWGWYWTSDYSWGWAPFHYGRWCTYPGLGWCWVPGSVWGPSWVTWRHCDSHIGWAPLPPACGWSTGVGLTWYGEGVSVSFGFGLTSSCYTFVPYDHFCHRNLAYYHVRGHQAHGIYGRTTVVNNVSHGDHHGFVNHGVGLPTVAARTRNEVPKVRVQPLPNDASKPLRADRMERSKDGMVVYKPSPVDGTPGQSAPIRSEVRPRSTQPSTVGAVPPGGTRSPVNPPTRPNMASRYSTGAPTAGKPVEMRGQPAGASAAPGVPSASGGRAASVTDPRPAYIPPASRSTTPSRGVPAAAPKSVETRGAYGSSSPASPAGASGAVAAPGRQTTPVPLGDPSRNLPAGAREVPARGTGSAVSPSKPPTEVRSGSGTATSGDGTAPRSYQSTPRSAVAPAYNPPSSARGSSSAPSAGGGGSRPVNPGSAPSSSVAPRSSYSTPAPSAAPAARPSYSAPSPSTAPSSRPSYSTPSPSMAPAPRSSYSTPSPSMAPASRPSYSAPSPSMAPASRPSYSAPSPSMAPPSRPSYSAPTPSMSPASRPSSPAPAPSAAPSSSPGAGSGSRGGGSRSQPN